MNSVLSNPVDSIDAPPVTVCQICQATQLDRLYHQHSFDVFRCKQCATVFVAPTDQAVLSKLGQQAAEEGQRYMRQVFIERQAFWLDHWTERLQQIEALFGQKGRLLDIGCAMGYFQLAAERRGWTSIGVELSQEQVAYARKALGLEVYASRFEEVDLEPASFDLVTLWSVIEHVPNPREFLIRARMLLKPDGILALQTPNQSSLITILAKLGYLLSGGRFLLPIYSLDHIFRFDRQTLQNLLERSGYEVIRIEQYDNLEVMLARMAIQPGTGLRWIVLWFAHKLAAVFNRRNQLIAYARPVNKYYTENRMKPEL